VVITVAALQVAVTLMRPNSLNLVYGAASGHEVISSVSVLTSGVVTQTLVVTLGSTQTQTMLVTLPPQTVTNNITLPPQTIPPDYSPLGIAVVFGVGILALFAMFLKRRR
jgi:hypothetical protein